MNIFEVDKNNLLAISLLALLVIFLSCPFLVKAESSVNSFFAEDFVKKGFFNEEINNSLVTKAGKQKQAEPVKLNPVIPSRADCSYLIRSMKDSFSIPTELVNCSYNRSSN